MSKTQNKQFVQIVKAKMKELDLNNDELAKRMGISPSTVGRYLSGEIENMRRDNIIKMSDALNISPITLMGWDVEEDSEETIIINRAVSKMSSTKKKQLVKILDAMFEDEFDN